MRPSFKAGTGVFSQTSGSVGYFGPTRTGTNSAVSLAMGGNLNAKTSNAALSPTSYSSLGTYTLGNANGTAGPQGMPLFVGGSEFIGVSGTATFTQNCGTNSIFGGGIKSALGPLRHPPTITHRRPAARLV